ncbi:hypothetical protein AB1Y20_009099 [Prymnesium parvum]|uniref:Cilia- and flagella-associated protein 53 n=1 Tax=Prymnesium parvum TaxID=97485 RepID=A0AB34JZE6_PRYPA|mmetsp:Transcript_36170/g.89991  ORF Transcript_36170/g.89991 Transcript_36170/m.89991 type:complete len:481 (-) Transcript_36170:10-1452(-)
MAPRGAPDYLILKRRKAEEDRRAYEGYTRSNFKAETNAEWEIRTQGVIENTQTKQRYESIRRADQQALDIRRRKLAEMLGAEQAMFQYQLESLAEAPEQRKARMESRAKELKDKREQERLEFVRQQYERQWRLACDPLRELESKAILRATNAARAYQIGEKMKALEMEEEENRAFDELWERDRQAKLGREGREDEARRMMDMEHKMVLDQQVAELHDSRAAERELSMEEAEMMKVQWEIEHQEAAKVEALRREVLENAQKELHEFNKQKRQQLSVSVAEEREADLMRLQAQLDAEKAEEQREVMAREAMQKETRLFAEHMLKQKRAVASREAEIAVAQKAELDKAWEKRLAVWGQEQEAREKLMAQVLHERKMQVERKLQDVKIDKSKQAEARVRLEDELARVNQIEAQKLEEGRQTRLEHSALLQNQIKEKAFQKAAAQFNKAQERMAAERAEAAYQAMLHDQMSKTSASMEKYTSTGT